MRYSLLTKIVFGLWLVGTFVFIGACYFLLWKANGDKFFPLTSPLIPANQWPVADQDTFMVAITSSVLAHFICYLYVLGLWTVKIVLRVKEWVWDWLLYWDQRMCEMR